MRSSVLSAAAWADAGLAMADANAAPLPIASAYRSASRRSSEILLSSDVVTNPSCANSGEPSVSLAPQQ
jgi:hypothetical protein